MGVWGAVLMAGNPPKEMMVAKVLSEPGEPWGGGNGKSQMRTYDEILMDADNQTRKVYVPVGIELSEGATVKGWFNDQKGTYTIADDNAPPRSGGGSSGGGDDFERRPDHPVQMQRALHTSSMSLAPVLIDQMLTIGVVPQPKDKDEYLLLVEGVATWVQQSYPAAVLAQAGKNVQPPADAS